jgi:hypothetical protein
MTPSGERVRSYVALVLVGLLAFACSSDDQAPGDTTGVGGADSGADHSASGGAGGSGEAGSGAMPDSGGGAPIDADLTDVGIESGAEANPTMDVATGGDATDAANDVPDAANDATDTGVADSANDVVNDVPSTGNDAADTGSDAADSGADATDGAPACTGDLQCQGGTWRCDLGSHTCVPCLPGVTDNCPAGQYCTSGFTCVPGCKGNNDCTSGACTNHECDHCQNDNECAGGNVCGTTVCAPSCTGPSGCANGFDCCTGHCTDLARDIRHCGGCGSACDANQFCGSSGCDLVTIANVCDNAATTKVLNTFTADSASNAVIQAGLVANCTPVPTTGSIQQADGGLINPTTGQPVAAGGNLLTVAGGYYVHKVVDYLDRMRITPVYLFQNGTDYWRYYRRGGGTDAGADGGSSDALVAEMAWTDSSTTHDLIAIELVRDPASGTLVLIAFGQYAESTAAAAAYVANQMLPVANRSSYDKSWYVYEWTAASEAGPETYTLKASGP